ncbi:response regulator [Altererythrobacter xixiisoli]|uniref:Response regulator n=1 Tax=Croceibacterium xixiisoli TaxID=1476466 RepID=A0A6I4U2D1_9SPHN|nr:response regulator [Croceibacterium xixiisoli]MXP00794.1 response regulator [Croceibacterium xixiisoli]
MLRQTVLVVEDEPLVSLMVEDELADAGFESVITDTASAAIELIEKTETQPIAIITDIRLREGSGWDVGRAARRRFPHLPIIYTSGDAAGEWKTSGVNSSIFLQKPVPINTIAQNLQRLCGAG